MLTQRRKGPSWDNAEDNGAYPFRGAVSRGGGQLKIAWLGEGANRRSSLCSGISGSFLRVEPSPRPSRCAPVQCARAKDDLNVIVVEHLARLIGNHGQEIAACLFEEAECCRCHVFPVSEHDPPSRPFLDLSVSYMHLIFLVELRFSTIQMNLFFSKDGVDICSASARIGIL